jgi:hypothetical protein
MKRHDVTDPVADGRLDVGDGYQILRDFDFRSPARSGAVWARRNRP